mgnify:CR=1 FL=1
MSRTISITIALSEDDIEQITEELHQRFPELNIYDLYQDIRTYGRGHEDYYVQACKNSVRFLRYHGDEMPELVAAPEADTHPVLVKVSDYLTLCEEV